MIMISVFQNKWRPMLSLIRRPLCGYTRTARGACGLRQQQVTLQQLDISGSLRPLPDWTRAPTEDMSPLTISAFRCYNIDLAWLSHWDCLYYDVDCHTTMLTTTDYISV